MNRNFFLLLLLLLCPITAYCQSPRMQLIEEFTSEDDFQSALQDPAFNLLMAANTSNTICIKYEESYPTGGGFLAFSGSNANCMLYYNVNGPGSTFYPALPFGLQDGKAFIHPGNTNKGSFANFNQSDINNRSSSLSPFSITISHSFSPNFDTVYATATITATQAYTAYDSMVGNIRFRFALVEREIDVKNPTGLNGQNHFFNVHKGMIPDFSGFVLPNVWTPGQTITISTSQPFFIVPNALYAYPMGYLIDYSQIAFIGYLQDDGYNGDINYNSVLQAAYSAPIPIPSNLPDIGITNITQFPKGYCLDSIIPVYKVTNHASPVVNSFTVSSSTNNFSTSQAISWNSGNLAIDSSVIITFPRVSLNPGADTLVGKIDMLNGYAIGNSLNYYASTKDYNCSNNLSNSFTPVYYSIQNTPKDTNWNVSLDDGNFSYNIVNPQHALFYLAYQGNSPGSTNPLGAYANSIHSFAWDFPDFRNYALSHASVSIISPKLDLTGKLNIGLRFDYAYAKENSSNNDTLEVQASIDCGDHWQTVWLKSGTALATAPDDSIGYFAPTANQWQSALIDLTAYDNASDLMIRFNGIEDGGNMLYLDNINLKAGLFSSAENLSEANTQLLLYPNPSSDFVSLRLSSLATIKSVEIYNVVGSLVYKQLSNTPTIDISALTNGIYFIKAMDSNGNVLTSKFTKL